MIIQFDGINLKPGDEIGGIYQKSDGTWYMDVCKVQKIVANSRGIKVYSKNFYPQEIEDLIFNTEASSSEKYITVREVVIMTPNIKQRCERWVKWANKNPNKVSCF